MRTVSAGTFRGEDVQEAQWRRALACQWIEQEGLVPRQVMSASVIEDGKVIVQRLVMDEGCSAHLNDEGTGPAMMPPLVITPKTPPPWLEWE